MKSHNWPTILIIGVLIVTVILAGVALSPLSKLQSKGLTASSQLQEVQPAASGPINGDYSGQASLQGVFNGVYNDATAPSPMDLGYIDLALNLTQSGNTVSGFVSLDHTLVFTGENTIMATPVGPAPGVGTPTPAPQQLAIGPHVQGTFDGTTFHLESDPFKMSMIDQSTLNDGRILPKREVTRQFRLVTTGIQGDGATLTGEYRETIWGYAPQPTMVVGTFTLQRPVFGAVNNPGGTSGPKVFLPIIARK